MTARSLLQMGFYHRNEVYQAYVDTPLSRFADEDPQTPESLRLVLSAELCASLAGKDTAKANGCRLAALLELALANALDERCLHPLSHVKIMHVAVQHCILVGFQVRSSLPHAELLLFMPGS